MSIVTWTTGSALHHQLEPADRAVETRGDRVGGLRETGIFCAGVRERRFQGIPLAPVDAFAPGNGGFEAGQRLVQPWGRVLEPRHRSTIRCLSFARQSAASPASAI